MKYANLKYANWTKQQKHAKVSSLLILALITIHFTLTTISCDLFNNKKDPHFLEKIDAEIAWANAAKLTVAFHAPEGWINSSSPSLSLTPIARNVLDIRKGFPFTLECEPSAAYGFDEWLAFE
ncbi:MAG: hypothetical protein FWH41_06185, partial [Treponema sp.]|nr:hypothetical protein [Treponema sp.]